MKKRTEKEKLWEAGSKAKPCTKEENKIELSNIKEVDKIIESILEYCEQCDEDLPKEHTCYTCCGNEITGEVEDIGLCPTCLEHI
jgi:hypothetical protein